MSRPDLEKATHGERRGGNGSPGMTHPAPPPDAKPPTGQTSPGGKDEEPPWRVAISNVISPGGGDEKQLWKVVIAIIGAVGVIAAAVITGRATVSSAAAHPQPGVTSGPAATPSAVHSLAPSPSASGNSSGTTPATAVNGGWSLPGGTAQIDTSNGQQDESISDLVGGTRNGTTDLSFSGDREPGLIGTDNGAEITDMGMTVMPSVADCQNALQSPQESANENSQEFYCVKTGSGALYLMQEWEAFMTGNVVTIYDLTFWSPKSQLSALR
jgi:hypothetical protein